MGQGRSEGGFLAELSALPQEEWPSKLRSHGWRADRHHPAPVGRPDRPLAEYGLDSLGNLEVRTRIETGTGIRISPADITTVRNLAAHLYDALAAQADAPRQRKEERYPAYRASVDRDD